MKLSVFALALLMPWLAFTQIEVGSGPGQLIRQVSADAGSSNAPVLFCIGVHVEPFGAVPSELVPGDPPVSRRPGPSHQIPGFFRRQVSDLQHLARLVEQHEGCLTVQAQTPFTRVAAEAGEKVLAELAARGHEIGLHFHEDAHLGRGSEELNVATWTAVIKEELGWLTKAGAPRLRYWSGGNLYPGVLEAAASAGLQVMSDYKNPRVQKSDPRLLAIHPWRPAGGPSTDSLDAFCEHDPRQKVVYLPDGIFSRVDYAGMRRAQLPGGDWAYFDTLTEGLELSLRAARIDRVNVFHITVHPGEFRGGVGAQPYAVVEAWLKNVVDPLVQAGKVRWATFSRMADEFIRWEKQNPGIDPRGEATPGSVTPPTTAPTQTKGYITFAVNVHDWSSVGDSAETVLRLIGIFEKHRVRGDFYLTAPLVETYLEKRPEVVKRLKESRMTISYHVRAPHPLWRAFSGPLQGKTGSELEKLLADYESFRLDLETGGLDRQKPGGYRFVESVFGRKPSAVGACDAAPEVRAAACQVYAGMGAGMAVFYHETGTRPDLPFEWRNGLLARPSDFSITRFETPDNPQGVFWWNMMSSPSRDKFDPVKLLERRCAEWQGSRAPFITALIHENDFYRQGGPGWNSVYFDGEGPRSRPRRSPFDLQTPAASRPRPESVREAIFAKYEELVAYAAQHLMVVTSEDLLRMAGPPPSRQDRPAAPNASRQGPGPWDNDVLVYRVKKDGTREQLAKFERAGVPTLAQLKDGRVLAAFQHFPANDERNFDRVAVAFSGDEGRSWSRPEPITVTGMEEGFMRPFDPTLVPLPDGRVRLYFTSNRTPKDRPGQPAIYSAVSTNGVHFQFEPGCRFSIDGRMVIDCAVALHDGAFHLFVPDNGAGDRMNLTGRPSGTASPGKGYHATSSDGLSFTRRDDVSLPSGNRWLGNVQSDGAQLLFFGTGPGPWPVASDDGQSWSPTALRVQLPGADPGAVRLAGGDWLVAVTGSPRVGSGGSRRPR